MIQKLGLIMLLVLLNCTYQSADDSKKEYQLLYTIINGSASANTTCSNSTPSFSTLATAGTTSKCASCHGTGGSNQSIFDVTSYTSAKSKITIGSPESSLLYTKVVTGTMAQYSNSTINTAVYCWIKGGTNP